MSLSTLGGSGDGGSGGATAEVTPEQIDEIRRLVASNPILIGPLLEQFKQEDPELYERVGGQSALTNPEKLLRVLGEGGDDSGPSVSASTASLLPPSTLPPAHARLPATAPIHAPLPQEAMQSRPGGQTLSVTQEEADQIEGVCLLPFILRSRLLTCFVHRLWQWDLTDKQCFRRMSRATGMHSGRWNSFLRVRSKNKYPQSLLSCMYY
jgi:hypothetical protein